MSTEKRPLKRHPGLVPTADEQAEWQYRYLERIGMLCGTDNPTAEQNAIAKAEADAWLEEQPLASASSLPDDLGVDEVPE